MTSKIVILVFLVLIAVLLVGLLVAGIVRTFQMNASPNQAKFIKSNGEVILDGFYKGSVSTRQGNWRGKTFNYAQGQTGINNFVEDGKEITKYPFKTSIRQGIRDNIKVVRVDYNVAKNPFWVRPLVDEIVQIGEHKYLGKIHYRVLPGFPFTIGFFELEQ